MYKIPKRLRKELLTWLVSGTVLLGFLVASQPLNLALPVLLVPFGIFFVWVRSGVLLVALLLKRNGKGRKIKVVASSIAAVLLLIITLQSLGQLSVRDILLILSLVAVLALYFYKTDLI